MRKLSKKDAASHLLDAAISALLDRGDAVAAIVLGGASEDIFAGLLKREGRELEGARQEMILTIREFVALENPGAPPMAEKDGHDMLRGVFNWLRHNDREDDAQEMRLDFRLEAAAIVERAAENRFRLDGIDHPRMAELLALFRQR